MKMILSFALFFGLAGAASAQYAIDWFTLDGGGGQSSGGAYTLQGTIGQPDAGTSSGGAYTLHGGFWAAFAVVPTEGAPMLRIVRSGPSIVVAWPNPSTGFVLQETPSLTSPNWTDVISPPFVADGEKRVPLILNSGPGARFYRLRKP
jgi:hypothetical protein